MAEYQHILTVTLRPYVRFPIDMLRYDRCTPYTETDAGKIEQSMNWAHDAEIVVQVTCFTRRHVSPWRVARWHSFGVSVKNEVRPTPLAKTLEPRCEFVATPARSVCRSKPVTRKRKT